MLKFNLQTDLIVNVLGRVEAVLQSPSAMYKDMGEYLEQTTKQRLVLLLHPMARNGSPTVRQRIWLC